MAFEYGCDNRFFDQYFTKGASAVGTFGPLKAGGHTNGALCIVVAAAAATVVGANGLTISMTASSTEAGTYAAPAAACVVTAPAGNYAEGDIIGRLVIDGDVAEYVKAVVGGTLTSGKIDVYLQYLPR